MSDTSDQEKTEAPTAKRRADAKKKGQVPRSQELTSAFLLLGGAGAIQFLSGGIGTGIQTLFGGIVSAFDAPPAGLDGHVAQIREIARTTAAIGAPILLTLTGTALAIAGAQARGTLAPEALQPKWERLDPIKKAKEIWGPRAMMEFAKNLLKLILIGGVTWIVLNGAFEPLSALIQKDAGGLLATARSYAVRLLMATGLAYLVIAAIDYTWQVYSHEKSLKMSKEEIKKEVKESEGDQIMKVRRRSLARSMARRRMLLSVSDADVVVTNPTHIAVALKYDPEVSDAPIVLAMGERKVAQKIKEIAKENGVPTVENKPLARALYATATVGEAIPIDLFVAVAEVLAFVIRQRGARPAWAGSARA